MAGRTYAEKPPVPGARGFEELAGPVTGVVRLPLQLDWSERTEFHLDDPAERNVMYERVMGLHRRKNEPTRLAVGVVLLADDAVANKVCALFGLATY